MFKYISGQWRHKRNKPRRGKVKEKEEIFIAILCNHTVAEHTVLFSWAQFKKKATLLHW